MNIEVGMDMPTEMLSEGTATVTPSSKQYLTKCIKSLFYFIFLRKKINQLKITPITPPLPLQTDFSRSTLEPHRRQAAQG